MISEFSDPTITEQQLTLDGKEQSFKAPFGNAPMLVSAQSSENKDTLFIESKMSFGNRDFTTKETWTLNNNGKILSITQSSSFTGNSGNAFVFEKQ